MDWGRLITAMVTPFDEDLQVDYKKAAELAKKLVEEGSSALVVCGTTGEAPTLTQEEKESLFKCIKENVSVPIIAGVGTNCTATTIENGKRALACGADGLLVVVPYYNKPNQDCLYLHYKAVAEALEGDIIMYNVPGRTGCNMLPSTLEKLSKIKNIVAIKESSGNIVQLTEMVKAVPQDFKVYTGEDSQTLCSLAAGAYGVVSVSSHVVGPQMKEMIDCYLRGEVKRAAEINLELLDIFNKLFITTNPIPVKAALNMMNINVGELRLPLSQASPEIMAEIQRSLRKIKMI